MQVEKVMKVFGCIAVGFAQTLHLDEVEDHRADVVGGADAPLFEDDGGHHTELADGEIAHAAQEFPPADVLVGVFLVGVFIRSAESILP